MKRRLKQLGWLAAGAVFVLVVFVVCERVRGRRALAARLAELRAKGERLSIAELEPKRPVAGRNAFNELTGIHRRIKAVYTNELDGPPSFTFTSPGHATVGWRLSDWPIDKKSSNNWVRYGGELKGAQALAADLQSAAMEAGYDSGFDYHKGFLDFKLSGLVDVKACARLLNDLVLLELRSGSRDAAVRDLDAMVRLSAMQRPEPLVICQLVRQACAAIAFGATWEALRAPGWTDAQLAWVQSSWEGCNLLEDLGRAMEMERDMNLDFYDQVKNSTEKLARMLPSSRPPGEHEGWLESLITEGEIPMRLRAPLWRAAWADQNELMALNRWQVMIERERLAATNSWAALPNQFATIESYFPSPEQMDTRLGNARLGWYDRTRFLIYNDNFAINDTIIRGTLCHQTEQQLALAALAIHRYRLKYGKLPVDLDVLVPEFLHALPRDFMDGKALRYHPQTEGAFLLYSVGEDGKDDGGNPTPRESEGRTPGLWAGRDAVWPLPAAVEQK